MFYFLCAEYLLDLVVNISLDLGPCTRPVLSITKLAFLYYFEIFNFEKDLWKVPYRVIPGSRHVFQN